MQKIKLEPVTDGASTDGDEDGGGYASEITVLDSDESQASIFGLRSALHELEKDDEMSGASSHDKNVQQPKESQHILEDPESLSVRPRLRIRLWKLRAGLRTRRASSGGGMEQS